MGSHQRKLSSPAAAFQSILPESRQSAPDPLADVPFLALSRLRGRGLGEGLLSSISMTMFPVRRQISPHAARLRREQTDVERAFWLAVRNRRLDGFKFRRQATIGPYVVDFLCVEAMLIIELDGGQHAPGRDAVRTRFLEERGYRVLRVWNNDISENMNGVLSTALVALLQCSKTLTQPSPAKAGEG